MKLLPITLIASVFGPLIVAGLPTGSAGFPEFGTIVKPIHGRHFAPGDSFTFIMKDYPANMSEFRVQLEHIRSKPAAITLQQGLGPNGNLSPVQYTLTLPPASNTDFNQGRYALRVYENQRDGTGHVVETGLGPRVLIDVW